MISTIGIILLILFGVFILTGIMVYNVPWYKLKKVVPDKKDELVYYRQFKHYNTYSTSDRFVKETIDTISSKFKNSTHIIDGININSKFNGIYYTVFDLDTEEKYLLFKRLYAANSYAIFCSSRKTDDGLTERLHYWALLDLPYDNISDIFQETNWKICNDTNYVSFCVHHGVLFLRGLYETKYRKPNLYETNGKLSENFQLFIDKLSMYYNKEALELSVLKYGDKELLIKYNRIRKIQELNKLKT